MGVKCEPFHYCERQARRLGGCVAGECNPPAPVPAFGDANLAPGNAGGTVAVMPDGVSVVHGQTFSPAGTDGGS